MNDLDLRAIFSDRKMSTVADATGIQYGALMRWYRGNDKAISLVSKEELKFYLQKNYQHLKKFF